MADERFDAVVVGAGQAGSVLLRLLPALTGAAGHSMGQRSVASGVHQDRVASGSAGMEGFLAHRSGTIGSGARNPCSEPDRSASSAISTSS